MQTKFFLLCFMFVALTACASPEEKAAEFLANGEQLLSDGDLVKARLEFRNALQIDNKLASAWYGLAQIAQQNSEWREAYGFLEKVLNIEPNNLDAKLDFARLVLISGDIERVLELSDELLASAGDRADVLSLRAAVLYKLEDTSGALDFAQQALDVDPNNVDALVVFATERLTAEDPEAALPFLDRGLDADPKNAPLYLLKIDTLTRLARWDGVEKTHLALVEQFPETDVFKHQLARFYLSQFREGDAEQVYRDLVEANPDDNEAKLNVVRFVNTVRGIDAAVAELDRYIEADPKNTELYFMLAQLYASSDQAAARTAVLEKVVEIASEASDVYKAQGLLAGDLARQGDVDGAMKLVEQILSADPRNEQALLIKASKLIDERSLDPAISDLRTILKDAPDSERALLLLAKAHELQGAVDLADDMYARAFTASGESGQYARPYAEFLLKSQRLQRAEAVLSQALPNSPRDVGLLSQLARVRLSLGNLEGAQAVGDQLRQVQDPEGLSDQIMGAIYAGQKDYEKSIDSFRAAVQAAPSSTRPLVSLIRAYVRAGRIDDAHEFLDSLLAANADNINAKMLKGQLFASQGAFAEAAAIYQSVIDQSPETIAAWRGLSAIKYREDSRDAAMAVLDDALAANPDDFTLLLNKASALEQQLQIEDAIAIYEKLIEIRPNADVVANNLASLLSDHRDDEQSLRRAHDLALRFRRSEVPYFQDTLGWTYFRLGNTRDSLNLIEQATERMPEMPVFHYHLGKIYQAESRSEEAKASFERALELAGDNDFAFRDSINEALEAL
jgi:pentatricopeptide repeat protein